MTNLLSDARYSLRVLMKYRGFTAAAVLTLALGIGATTAIFSMADAILLRPFPFPRLDRIVALSETIPKVSADRLGVSPGNFFNWKEQNHFCEQMTAYKPWDATLTGLHGRDPVQAYLASPDFFRLLGAAPFKGRFFSGREDTSEASQLVVSFGFWQQRLGADPGVLGQVVALNGVGYTVIGVMPKEFDFPMYAEVWAPWIPTPQDRVERSVHNLSVIARLRPGVSLFQARAETHHLGERLAREYPAANAGRGVDVMLLRDTVDEYARRFLAVLAAAVVFLLLLACANVANLQLARGASRQKEIAIRSALGAARRRLAQQLFTEGIMLSSLAAALGLSLAAWGLVVIKANLPSLVARHVPSLMLARLDSRMLVFTCVAALVTGILSTVPAILQVSPQRLYGTMKEGGRSSSASLRPGMRSALVISEVSFAAVLLICAGLMVKAFRDLTRTDQGFDPNDVLTFSVSLPTPNYPGNVQVTNFYNEALRRESAVPGVQSAALVSELPALADSRTSSVVVEGQSTDSADRPLLAEVRIISEAYFRVIAAKVKLGRAFTPQDDAASLPVAIISESAARRFWPVQAPLGRRLKLTSTELNTPWLSVVGTVGDMRHFFLNSEVRPTVYLPYRQQPLRSLNFVVRAEAGTRGVVNDVREAVRAVDSTIPVYGVEQISRYFADLAGGVGVIGTLMGVFGAIALALAAAGVYAVMAYSVAQRTREIGIRVALGAQPMDIWKLVLGNTIRLLGIGLGLGLPVAIALGRLMSSVLPGVVELDLLSLLAFTAVLSATGLLAGYLPARHATQVSPIVALVCE